MKRILAPILLLTLLFPSLAFGETVKFDDLVKRDGIHYKKFSTVPFTGKVTGKRQGTYRNGKEDGPWVSYYKNGQLFEKGTYKGGKNDGPWVSYWDDGQLEEKGTFKNGERDGPWFRYYSDGTVWKENTGTFKNGVKVD